MNRVKKLVIAASAVLFLIALGFVQDKTRLLESRTSAQAAPTATPVPAAATFGQAAAVAKLKEQIKGREREPAEKVFKNIQMPSLKATPAARLLAVMEFGYARSLGVNCTHCHTPDRWEAEDKPQKQIARDMAAMMAKINSPEMLRGIKNLKTESPTINCTTCHRGEVKPALNLPSR